MIIEKTATIYNNMNRITKEFCSARSGFDYIIQQIGRKDVVYLLPAYVGLSPKEGSGIFDPIKKNDVSYKFYKLDNKLQIDVDYLTNLIESESSSKKIVLLIVHYFGFVDSRIEDIDAMAKSKGVTIIEDEAHALFTDYVDNRCGKYGAVSIFSLHKMLPYETGGLVRDNYCTGFL